jgi:hypothetical protein
MTSEGPTTDRIGYGRLPAETFFDPDTHEVGIPQVRLERVGPGSFKMLSRIGYRHPDYQGTAFVVPRADTQETYRTDLASIPAAFTWLVPIVGTHMPAALIHDGLITSGDPEHEGPEVTRQEADDIFRDAMRLSGTRRIRRWLVWTGVSLGTMWEHRRPRWLWRPVMVAYFAILTILGLWTTADVLDVSWSWLPMLPWLGDRPWYLELASGTVMAVLVPSVLSLFWGNRRTVGRIAGIALAFLLHPTIFIVAVTIIYVVAERFASKDETYPAA